MKKFFLTLILLCCVVGFTGLAMASDAEVKVPTVQNGNVVVPHSLIATVPGWEKGEVLCAFHDLTGKKSRVAMQHVGDNWVVPGGQGTDIHPVVVIDGTDHWTLLEALWARGASFIKERLAGPCLHLK